MIGHLLAAETLLKRRGAELTYGTRVTIPVTHALNHSVYISR